MQISLSRWFCEEDMQQFAARLKEAREARKMTQARLAELLEVDRRVYNRWERGASVPQLDAVVRIAQVLQTSLDSLVGLEPMTPPQIHNPRLQALVTQMDSLSDEDQQALIVLMDSLLKRSKMTQLLTS
ncbi:helix-turn-helix transcriptional regulator [Dickeya lacustris]|uniref:Helix-turn-helix transcriptional regulator n=1 Tax=Dickeya lacustris TaxID=2259638 RepID=A0ABY8G8B9_9GAMM|nr:helix-turn-helix transcriptional regulator [Dickeya lacustris]WFN56223.1 helix-turn-helix transcriptional regulator [Dickeya lacustris]